MINKNNRADITSIIKIVVISVLEKKIKANQKARLNLVIKESYASLEEKYEFESSKYKTKQNNNQIKAKDFTWKEVMATWPNQEDILGPNQAKFIKSIKAITYITT